MDIATLYELNSHKIVNYLLTMRESRKYNIVTVCFLDFTDAKNDEDAKKELAARYLINVLDDGRGNFEDNKYDKEISELRKTATTFEAHVDTFVGFMSGYAWLVNKTIENNKG